MTLPKKILVATDFSSRARHAEEVAMAWAERLAPALRERAHLAGLAHRAHLGPALEQPHVVEHVVQGDELARRRHTRARALAHAVDPPEDALVEFVSTAVY